MVILSDLLGDVDGIVDGLRAVAEQAVADGFDLLEAVENGFSAGIRGAPDIQRPSISSENPFMAQASA